MIIQWGWPLLAYIHNIHKHACSLTHPYHTKHACTHTHPPTPWTKYPTIIPWSLFRVMLLWNVLLLYNTECCHLINKYTNCLFNNNLHTLFSFSLHRKQTTCLKIPASWQDVQTEETPIKPYCVAGTKVANNVAYIVVARYPWSSSHRYVGRQPSKPHCVARPYYQTLCGYCS